MMRREKNTEEIKVWIPETMKTDLKVLAAKKGFDSLSPLIRKILREYLYGHYGDQRDLLAGTVRDE